MLYRFICCFTQRNVIPHVVHLTTNTNKNIEDICVRITDKPLSQNTIGLLDTKTLYDSTEWLNKLDKQIDWKDVVKFVPPVEKGIVIKVYDGDTITIATRLPYKDSPLYRFPVRLKGIDSAEIKSKNANEKIHAKIARDALSELILHKNVLIQNIENEKYGRILADVYYNDLFINEWMIEKGFAVKYDGGTKQIPSTWTE